MEAMPNIHQVIDVHGYLQVAKPAAQSEGKKINLIFVETRFAGTELVEHSSQPPSNVFLCSALELVVPILPLIFTPSTLCLLKSLEPLFFFPSFSTK